MTTAQRQQTALLAATFVIAVCGLIYELLAGTLSSYLMGNSVYQFSLVIGLFMSAMGLGAWASRFIDKELPHNFVRLQLLVGLLGGLISPILFFAFAVIDNYTPLLVFLTLLLGAMLGIEIPLIIRILKDHFSLKTNLSNVFTADYIGALIAALLFPLVLIPQLGILQTGFIFGLMNIAVGMLALYVLRENIPKKKGLWGLATIISGTLIMGLVFSTPFTNRMEKRLYQDQIIFSTDTPYQRLVLTKRHERIRFYINGALQFDSFDEYRYHESLVHPVLSALPQTENVLVLGGGDGLAVKQLLKYPSLKSITLVDLDPAVTTLFKNNQQLVALNNGSLDNDKVTIHNTDAWKFLEHDQHLYDVIIIDLPDPSSPSLSRLYTASFYKLVKQHLSQQGVIVTQATSPFYTQDAFWSIESTLRFSDDGSDWYTLPYHTYIPSFGEWGFVMAARHRIKPSQLLLSVNNDYLDEETLEKSFIFPKDMQATDVEINQLSSHQLLQYYEQGWKYWYQ